MRFGGWALCSSCLRQCQIVLFNNAVEAPSYRSLCVVVTRRTRSLQDRPTRAESHIPLALAACLILLAGFVRRVNDAGNRTEPMAGMGVGLSSWRRAARPFVCLSDCIAYSNQLSLAIPLWTCVRPSFRLHTNRVWCDSADGACTVVVVLVVVVVEVLHFVVVERKVLIRRFTSWCCCRRCRSAVVVVAVVVL